MTARPKVPPWGHRGSNSLLGLGVVRLSVTGFADAGNALVGSACNLVTRSHLGLVSLGNANGNFHGVKIVNSGNNCGLHRTVRRHRSVLASRPRTIALLAGNGDQLSVWPVGCRLRRARRAQSTGWCQFDPVADRERVGSDGCCWPVARAGSSFTWALRRSKLHTCEALVEYPVQNYQPDTSGGDFNGIFSYAGFVNILHQRCSRSY